MSDITGIAEFSKPTLLARADTSVPPTLTTSTTSPTTATTATTTAAANSMPVLSLPKITTSATSHNWVQPTITPPSASGNPNIWKSTAPSGTVFIAVGAVAGFFLLCFILFLFIRKMLARRAAKNSLSFDFESEESFLPPKLSDKIINPFQSHSSKSDSSDDASDEHKYPHLYDSGLNSEYNSSETNINDNYARAPENFYSTLDNSSNTNLKRKSMFISPTAEVMHIKKQPSMGNISVMHPNSNNSSLPASARHSRVYSNMSNFAMPNDSASQLSQQGVAPPQRTNNHRRESSYDSGSLQSPERSMNRAPNRSTRNVPSVYLDAMFEDD